jgi:hypothetical protein
LETIMTRKLLVVCALLAACADQGKTPVEDSFTDLAGLDEKSDRFTGRITRVGAIAYGETKGPISHRAGKWSAFTFLGSEGDELVIDVTSTNGDTIAWLVDKSMNILAFNDDVGDSTNSHIEFVLRSGANTTFFIVTREYDRRAMKFSVTLKGKKRGNFSSPCAVDADCAITNAACCGDTFVAVRSDQAAAYHDSLACDSRLACPTVLPPGDLVAECISNTCTAVKAADIQCGGFSQNPHECPAGYVCEGEQLAVDGPGKCSKFCGGIAGFPCDGTDICVDMPNDGCDPNAGGVDCSGVCKDAICSGQTARCAAGYHWDQYQCTCVENSFCGGIAGFPCPTGKKCIDDPRDDCDPAHGGADCGGMCVPDTDCRSTGCARGQYCTFCWSSYACIPEGAIC